MAREGAGGAVDRLRDPPIWGFFLCLLVGPPFYVQAVFVNQCGSPRVCDFVCDCWDCSDENQCGELISFLFLLDELKTKLQQKRWVGGNRFPPKAGGFLPIFFCPSQHTPGCTEEIVVLEWVPADSKRLVDRISSRQFLAIKSSP